MVFSTTIENTTEIWFIIEKYVLITLGVPLKPDFITEWSNGTEWYSQIPLKIPLKFDLLLSSMFKYRWENHWNKMLSLNGPMVFSNTIENTTKIWFIIEKYVPIPLGVPLKPDFIIEWFNGIEWYSQIPLRIPMKSNWLLKSMFRYLWEYHWKHDLSLSSPMVLNGTLKYHWEYHWSLIYCWKVCSETTAQPAKPQTAPRPPNKVTTEHLLEAAKTPGP